MDFERAFRLTAFFVGAFLHGALVFGVLRGSRDRPAERVLRLFFLALFLWHVGSFVALAFRAAIGPGAVLVRRLANVVAFGGLAFLPTFLLDAVMSEGWERVRPRRPSRLEGVMVRLAYLPLLGLPVPLLALLAGSERPPLVTLERYIVPWTVWFVAVLLVSAGFSLRIGRAAYPRAPGAAGDARDRRLDVRLAMSFLVAAAGLAYAYLLDGRDGPWGYTVETLVMSSSILPSLVFAYHVYRYRVLGYVVRESAVSLLASASFVALYLFILRAGAARLESAIGLPAAVLEGTALVLLVLLFEPYGDSLRALGRRYLAGGRERLRQAASECAVRLARASDAGEVEEAIRSTIGATELVARATLLVAEGVLSGSPAVRRLEGTCPAVAAVLASGAEVVRRDQAPSAEALAELERLQAHAVLALRTRERLHGALVVGGKGRRGLYPEDLEELQTVAQGAALALQASRLFGEKLHAERKAAHAERMASLGWLAAGVAHEVKNPLSSIKAVAQVLRAEAGEGSRIRADLDVIVSEADRLHTSVERLLATARTGREQASAIPLTLALDRLAIALGPQARARGVTFEFKLGARSARVHADPDRIWDVFYNLAVNAIEAMPRGGTFRVEEQTPPGEAGDEAPAGQRVVLRVSDAGPGIPSELEPHLFDGFVTTKADGHGLGLALVRRRLAELGGTIALLAGGPGAVFEIRLGCRVDPDAGV